MPAGDGAWPALYSQFNAGLTTADALIVDLRGNGGGDDQYIYPVFQSLLVYEKMPGSLGGSRQWILKDSTTEYTLSLTNSVFAFWAARAAGSKSMLNEEQIARHRERLRAMPYSPGAVEIIGDSRNNSQF